MPNLFGSQNKKPPHHWKPEGCSDCGTVHPSWSLTGPRGPWRCRDCHIETQAKNRKGA
jgi:hypothetical protein